MNKRLQAIGEMVMPDAVMADIGTDHAYLPIELVRSGKTPKAYACDIVPGPLKMAEKNIAEAGLNDQITTVLSDGLAEVSEDVEVIVLAGMGCYTAIDILEAYPEKVAGYKQIIIQVNTDVDRFRKWISDHRYTIVREKMVFDRHYYTIMEISLADHEPYSDEENILGPELLKEKSPVFMEYVAAMHEKQCFIASVINKDDERLTEVNRLRELYEKVMDGSL